MCTVLLPLGVNPIAVNKYICLIITGIIKKTQIYVHYLVKIKSFKTEECCTCNVVYGFRYKFLNFVLLKCSLAPI